MVFSLPWNQKTVPGWIADCIFDSIVAIFYFIVNYGILVFFLAICEFHSGFLLYYSELLKSLEAALTTKKENEIRVILCDAICFHVTVKTYVKLLK